MTEKELKNLSNTLEGCVLNITVDVDGDIDHPYFESCVEYNFEDGKYTNLYNDVPEWFDLAALKKHYDDDEEIDLESEEGLQYFAECIMIEQYACTPLFHEWVENELKLYVVLKNSDEDILSECEMEDLDFF